jgi:hypothetical protein
VTLVDEPRLLRLQPIFEVNTTGDLAALILTYPGSHEFRLPVDIVGKTFEFSLSNK